MQLPVVSVDKIVFLDRPCLEGDSFAGALVVPLNQTAMRDVLAAGLPYLKIEEYFDYDFARAKKEDLYHAFDQLFTAADRAVAEVFGWPAIARFGPFNLYYMYLRANIETEIIYYQMFRNIVHLHRPTEVLLYGRAEASPTPTFATRRLATEHDVLLRRLAGEENFAFSSRPAAEVPTEARVAMTLLSRLRRSLARSSKRVKLFHRARRLVVERPDGKLPLRALFLQTAWGVFYYSQFFEKVTVDTEPIQRALDVGPGPTPGKVAIQAAVSGETVAALDRFNRLLGVDVTAILHAHLTEFLSRVPRIVAQARALKEHLSATKPDFVFYTNLSEDMLPLQIALQQTPGIVRAIKSHGDSIFDVTAWRKNELQQADLYWTEFPELAEYFQASAAAIGQQTVCVSDGVRGHAHRKRRTAGKILVYVPWIFVTSYGFDMNTYPAPLLMRVQTRILEELDRHSSYEIIYKCIPRQLLDLHFPMPDLIRKRFPRITISHEPLGEVLQRAACCLLDAPSSAMWEAIDADVPCHSLVWRRFHVRDSAAHRYAQFLTFFDSEAEVADIVRAIITEEKFQTISTAEARALKKDAAEIRSILRAAAERVRSPVGP